MGRQIYIHKAILGRQKAARFNDSSELCLKVNCKSRVLCAYLDKPNTMQAGLIERNARNGKKSKERKAAIFTNHSEVCVKADLKSLSIYIPRHRRFGLA